MPPRRPSKNSETQKARVLANRYEIVNKLGSGNFGTVFMCKDSYGDKEDKVVKEIYVGELQPDETVDANHEARLLSRLKHPNIVKYFDSFIDETLEYFCIVTEYCEGGDLDSKIIETKKKGRYIEEVTVLDWFVQLVLAVRYLHSQRVLHRDLKSRNIFLRKNKIKIGDFGISRILMSTVDYASTFTGTPYYMSPEVLKHEGYNSKSDIWSIGCILYEMCALEHAFDGQGLMAVMYKIVEGKPPDLPKRYSKDLNEVFKGMIIKNPDERPCATKVTQMPYVAKHMAQMKDLLSDEFKIHTGIDDNVEFRKYVSEKARMSDYEDASQKSLTPAEKAKIRKLRKAEEERNRLSQLAKENYLENQERKSDIRSTLAKSIAPVWVGGEGEGVHVKKMLSKGSDKIYREREATTLSHADLINKMYNRKDDDVDSDRYSVRPQASSTLPARNRGFEDRPITPMKNTMVYNSLHSTLDFEDGIPNKPELADTYYSQFDDEFENNEPVTPDDDDDEDEKTIIPANRLSKKASEEIDEENGEGTMMGEETQDMSEFIGCLQGALRSTTNESTINDDTGIFGPQTKEIKIKNMKDQCIKKLGKDTFDKVYNYLKSARSKSGKNKTSEVNIQKGMSKFVKNVDDCFLVEQLYFIENENI